MTQVLKPNRWNEELPPERAWRGKAGRSRASLSAEQDRAAGGRDNRMVPVGNGRWARASIELKVLPQTRRIRAYLRWSEKGRSPTIYLGEVGHSVRSSNLKAGWELARSAGLLSEQPNPPGSWASSSAVRAVMRGNRSRDTKPEIRLRSLLHAAGFRYRVSIRPLPSIPRTADIVFPKKRVAIFVDGCFWHGCPDHHRPAEKNGDYWREKIEANQRRDAETVRILSDAGWKVLRVWEHENPADAAKRIGCVLQKQSHDRQGSLAQSLQEGLPQPSDQQPTA
jgi:DNA mismatch endonuclease, patch repair protein